MTRVCLNRKSSASIGRWFALTIWLGALLGAAVPAHADKLTVYSYRQPFLVEPLFERFTRKTGIKVNVLYAKKGLIERLKLEGRNGPADILLASSTLRLVEAKEANLTRTISSRKVTRNIPAVFRDEDSQWVGLTRRGRVLFVSKKTVGAGEIKDYTDIVDGKHQICVRPLTHAYNTSLVAYMISKVGHRFAESWLRGVKRNLARPPAGNDRAQIREVNAGGCDVAIANSYYFGVMKADPKQRLHTKNVQMVFPTFSNIYGTFSFMSGIALLRSSHDPKEALKLIEFMVGEEAQRFYATVNHEYPVHKDLLKINRDAVSLDVTSSDSQVAQYRSDAIDLVESVMGK